MLVPREPPPSAVRNRGSQRPRFVQSASPIDRRLSASISQVRKFVGSESFRESEVSASVTSRRESASENARRHSSNASVVPRSGLNGLSTERGLPSNLAGSQYR